MLEITFAAGEGCLALVWLLLRCAVWLRQGRVELRREGQLLLMYFNLAVILRFVFFPFERLAGQIQPLLFDARDILPLRLNLVPLVHLLRFGTRRDLIVNLVGNVLLFVPSGILLPSLYKRLDRWWKVLLAGAGLSLCIELMQLPFRTRATDIDDLILNTLGVALGWAIFALARAAYRR